MKANRIRIKHDDFLSYADELAFDSFEEETHLSYEMLTLLDAIEKAQYDIKNNLQGDSFKTAVYKNLPFLKVG